MYFFPSTGRLVLDLLFQWALYFTDISNVVVSLSA